MSDDDPLDPPDAASVLHRAADRLETLDRDALAGPWWMEGNDLTTTDGYFQPEPRTIGKLAEEDGALVCTLRSVAGPLAAWLRHEAGYAYTIGPRKPNIRATAIARSVLGEEATS